MYYISLDCNYLEITNMGLIFLCIQNAKSSVKTILSKIFEQNVDYTKVDQFSTPSFKNGDIGRKIKTPSKKIMSNGR